MEACHGKLGRGNDSIDNLEWKTKQQNNHDDKRRDRSKGNKFTPDQIVEIRQKSAAGVSQAALAKEYDTYKSYIGQIVRQEVWADLEEVV